MIWNSLSDRCSSSVWPVKGSGPRFDVSLRPLKEDFLLSAMLMWNRCLILLWSRSKKVRVWGMKNVCRTNR